MLRALRADIFDIPIPDLTPTFPVDIYRSTAPVVQSMTNQQMAQALKTAPPGGFTTAETLKAWVERNKMAVYIVAGALLTLALVTGGRRR
jgi:hypothetical protein